MPRWPDGSVIAAIRRRWTYWADSGRDRLPAGRVPIGPSHEDGRFSTTSANVAASQMHFFGDAFIGTAAGAALALIGKPLLGDFGIARGERRSRY